MFLLWLTECREVYLHSQDENSFSNNINCPYLSHILRVRAHVLLQHEELVPDPASLDPLESPGTSIPPPRRRPRQTAGPLLPRPALEWSAGALLEEEAQDQQKTVPPQHWAVRSGAVPASRSRGERDPGLTSWSVKPIEGLRNVRG